MIEAGGGGGLSTFGRGLDRQVFCARRSTAETMEDPYGSCDRAGFDFLVRSIVPTEQENEKLLSTDDLYRLCLASPLLLLRHVECTTPPPIISLPPPSSFSKCLLFCSASVSSTGRFRQAYVPCSDRMMTQGASGIWGQGAIVSCVVFDS